MSTSEESLAVGGPLVRSARAFAALLLGGSALGLSPIFVRLADVGPTASAFWRLALALPVLWFWSLAYEGGLRSTNTRLAGPIVLAGLFFAADLAVWHWSITYTTVANSTLLANFAPIFVTLSGWFMFRQRVSGVFMIAMCIALGGTTLLVGPSFAMGERQVVGDALGLLTAVFYAGYMLSIKRARERTSTATLMALGTTVSVALLLPVALLSAQPMLPAGLRGWSVLLGLALVSQVLGQSLLAYGVAHLSAALSSVVVLVQPIVATAIAWLLFREFLGTIQILGGVLVLSGIFVARRTG